MQHKSIERRHLGDRVAGLAWEVAACIARAIELQEEPPTGAIFAERNLWRWAERLRRAAPQHTKPAARQVAVVLVVEIAGSRDPDWVGQDLVRAAGESGDGWQIRHHSTHPDPAAIYRRRPRGSRGEAAR